MLVLVASPLLGGEVWQPVAELLDAVVVAPRGRSAAEVLSSLLDQLPAGDLVLVPHSNAGLYVGAVSAARRVAAAVFVDAGLPVQDGPTPTAPPAVLDMLAGLADDDRLLPPWTSWWRPEDVEPLFPEPRTRARIEAGQPRLPLSYFTDAVPAAPEWQRFPCAYLAFGDTYADEVVRARDAGWPVSRLDGRHLHMLVDPHAVAEEVRRLVALLRR